MKIGYAMYSARELTTDAASMRSVLNALADMGYEGVELFLYNGVEADELKQMLAEYHLEPIATHVHKPRWDGDTAGEIAYAAKAGIPRLVYPWVDPDCRTEEFYKSLPAQLQTLATACSKQGVKLVYHNHDFEFESFAQSTVIDFLLESEGSFEFELDTFWTQHAGVNAVDYMRKLGKRIPMIHIKDYLHAETIPPAFCAIGTGKLDNAAVILEARTLDKEWVIIELDNTPIACLESARISIETVKRILRSK